MQWLEATIDCISEGIDDVMAIIENYAVTGIAVEDEQDFQKFLDNNHQYWDYVDEELEKQYRGTSRVKFYVENTNEGEKTISEIAEILHQQVITKVIEDADWGNSWKQYYEPIPIGEKLLIVPEWMDTDPGERHVVRLDPGIGFGTGSHPTTQMTLELLEQQSLKGKKVLDLGCGSGILGISALILGCDQAILCDIDPKARESVSNNMELNGLTSVSYRFLSGDLLSDERIRQKIGADFEIVLANIVADVIIPLSSFVRRFFASSDSVFICSGIIDERSSEVELELLKNGFDICDHLQMEEWHAFLCRVSNGK